jgi:hypothetical protein
LAQRVNEIAEFFTKIKNSYAFFLLILGNGNAVVLLHFDKIA